MRTTRGLPFNASYASTVMHEVLNHLCQSLFFLTNLYHNHELYQGVAPPGLTYLTYRWTAKQGEGESETQARQAFMHSCVCSNHPMTPLIICNLFNLALYRLLALLHGSYTETRDKKCVCCIRSEDTPVVYTCFIEVFLRFFFFFFSSFFFLNFGFFLSARVESRRLLIYVCLVISVIPRDIRLYSYYFCIYRRPIRMRSGARSFSACEFLDLKNQEMTTNFVKMCI